MIKRIKKLVLAITLILIKINLYSLNLDTLKNTIWIDCKNDKAENIDFEILKHIESSNKFQFNRIVFRNARVLIKINFRGKINQITSIVIFSDSLKDFKLDSNINTYRGLKELRISGISEINCKLMIRGIKEIHISNHNIENIPSNSIISDSLITLSVTNGNLIDIPLLDSCIGTLIELDFVSNSINQINSNILKYKNLTKLYLSDNKIEKIPIYICDLINLKIFHIFANDLVEIPNCLYLMKNILEFGVDDEKKCIGIK